MIRTIGVIAEFVTGVYLGEVVSALYRQVAKRGARLIAIRTGDVHGHYSQSLGLDCADAWIVVLNSASHELAAQIVESGKPGCAIGYNFHLPGFASVRSDNRAGVNAAMQRLWALGHRRFAFVGYPLESDIVEREAAFRDFIRDHADQGAEARIVACGDYSYLGGFNATGQLLAGGRDFTALLAGNDQNALGAQARVREAGLRVPEDVMVVGYDNSPMARAPGAGLASLDQDYDAQTNAALDILWRALDGPAGAPTQIEVRVPPRFVPRASVGVPENESERATIPRDIALSSIAASDEMNRFMHAANQQHVPALLARLASRLRYAIVGDWLKEPEPQVRPRFVMPTHAKLLPTVSERRFPLGLGTGFDEPMAGDLTVVLPSDAVATGRSAIAVGVPARVIADDFDLLLLAHELELIAFGIERMTLHHGLEREVTARTEELRRVNGELARALDSLGAAQEELVRAEKHAALGTLVAGVAHEINTPLGNCVMSVSSITERARALRPTLEQGALKRSMLEDLFETIEGAGELIERNLQHAVARLADFRKLASHESGGQRSRFALAPLVREVLEVLRQRYPEQEIGGTLQVDDALQMDSYPLALVQVLTELVENAVLHGLRDRIGWVRVSVRAEAGEVLITVLDNGRGVPAEDVSKVFDPFFTSRMGQYSGLGLSMVFNLVTGQLRGRVWCVAPPDGGARFMVHLPLETPPAN
ncbi:substrate-binding domain-containing protein [Niveibacterium sp. SC-1]|uniref:substrate-binding domain-containing protein n=1 Tax=Niveibacterium sp. SC-1 TaxID=3135646 RepID=UPI00311FFBF2